MDLIITILPVVTKDLPISPRLTPYDFLSRFKFSSLTTRQPMVEYKSPSWYLNGFPDGCCCCILHINRSGLDQPIGPRPYPVVVVVVFFTLTDRASTIPSNIRGCQFGTWSQRGTKVNRSHHGDNPLLRPTVIQIATKSYATLQAMASTNIKTVHQTSFTPYRE